jgi:hypothetical protein
MWNVLANVIRTHDRELSDERLLLGLELYGTTMFEWDQDTRMQNFKEEISDARNYVLSGIWYELNKKEKK